MKNKKIILENDAELILDRARVILASTTITADIKRMIDKLGKLSTGTVMGISSTTSAAFGPEVASNFVKSITAQLNASIAQLQASSEAIDIELQKLDNITKGITDLSSDVGVDTTEEDSPPPEPTDTEDAADSEEDIEEPTDTPPEGESEGESSANQEETDDEVTDTDLDDMFGEQPDPALLKQKKPKESTKESVNLILKGACKKLL
jgi:hypothetical protein